MTKQLSLPGLEKPDGYWDFKERLEYSQIDTLSLETFYLDCFPHGDHIECVEDRAMQRQGIDTILVLKNGKHVHFDEKKRDKDYGDILIEEYSVWEERKVGWIGGDKMTDYITYIVKPTRKVYFLPFLLLQAAWLDNYHKWIEAAKCNRWPEGRIYVRNRTYQTTNIPVPKEVLFPCLYKYYREFNTSETQSPRLML